MKKITLIICCFYTVLSFAQDGFNTSPEGFVSSLSDFMLKYKSPAIEEQLATFSSIYTSLPAEQKTQIINQMSEMRSKGMSPKPYFADYMDAVSATVKDPKMFDTFLKGSEGELKRLQTRNFNRFKKLVSFFIDFGTHKALRYSKGSICWYVDYEKMDIETTEEAALLHFVGPALRGVRRSDSVEIVQFEGTFDIENELFQGKKGQVNWKRHEQPAVKADLLEYVIEVKQGKYSASKATLTYPALFANNVLEGSFDDNISNATSYPRFYSQLKNIALNELGSGVQFLGGFSLFGLSIQGSGTEENPATVKIVDQNTGKLFFKAFGTDFNIQQNEKVSAQEVEIVFYFQNDSITHKSLGFTFDIKEKVLELKRGETSSQQSPFFNSLHQVYMDVDNIRWQLGTDSIQIGLNDGPYNDKISKTASFASKNNFDIKVYNRMQGAADYNPISILKVMAEKEGTRELDGLQVVKAFNPNFKSISIARTLLYELVKEGFIYLDEEKELITVTDKLMHYGLSAQGKADFDFINLRSSSSQTNAVLNMKTNAIDIVDIGNVELSRKQKVGISAGGSKVTLQDGRDLDFDGKVFAGYTTMTGKKFHFDYEAYTLTMDTINYFDLFRLTGQYDENGDPLAEGLASRIQNLSGTLFIDDPANKSGRASYPQYPKFESKETSYVTYDEPYIREGAYDKDSFYYQLDPFTIESLDSFSVVDLSFTGALKSSGIFPPIKERLVYMEDNSLGFEHQANAFLDTYRGKGKYKGKMKLDLQGLTAEGEISYLGSSILSKDIVFMPREMTCTSEKYYLPSTAQRPEVNGENVSILWEPFKDKMGITAEEKPFEVFQSKDHFLAGTLYVSPDKVYGAGELSWERATVVSDSIMLYNNRFQADTASIDIKSLTGESISISTQNVSADFDLSKKFGEVFSNDEKGIEIKMPENQYITIMDGFDWNMATEEITYKSREKLSKFISIHPKQDSLTFYGTEAKYDLAKSIVTVKGVDSITCSDAQIFLPQKKVVINPDAVLDTFSNVKIIANLKEKNHLIENANVAILGRRSLKGSGTYNHDLPNKKQGLFFDNLEGKPAGKGAYEEKPDAVTGSAAVAENDNFYLDEVIRFEGDVLLDSRQKGLNYKGYALIEAPQLKTNWFAVEFNGVKDDMFIDFLTPKGKDGEMYHCGIYYSKEFSIGYPNLITTKLFRKDRALLEVDGKIHYNRNDKRVYFGDSIRMVNPMAKGTTISYDIAKDIVYADGQLELVDALNGMRVTSAGSVEVVKSDRPADDYIDDSYEGPNFKTEVNAMLGIELELPDKLLKIMRADLQASANPAPYVGEHYQKYMPFFVENKDQTALPDLNKGKPLKQYTFFLANLPLVWDQQYRSYASPKGTADLVSMDGQIMHKKIQAFFEFKMPTSEEDRLIFLLEGTSQYWYYFDFSLNEIYVTSSNPAFMSALEKMKSKELKINTKLGKPYTIIPEDVSRGAAFKSRVRGFNG